MDPRQAVAQDGPDGVVLTVHVQPGASRTEFAGLHGAALKFRVAAPPVEGAANEGLCAYLAEQLGLRRSSVVVQAGQSSRRKRILLKGVTAQRVREVFSLSH
ncbi:MAG: DUF167 domain-containing protein [Nitrospirota bacterium]